MVNATRTARAVKTRATRTVHVVRQAKLDPIEVTLPDVPLIPPQLRGKKYLVAKLLTDGEDNPKLAKSDKAGTTYRTYGVTMSPARSSGYQVCSDASPGCIDACLSHQGMAAVFPTIRTARIAKTIAFFEHRKAF